MTDNNKYCVILAGGFGSRLWPLSRMTHPKQFLEVADSGKSFLQDTYGRFCTMIPPENILVVTAMRHRDYVMEQLPGIKEENVLLEPYSRNTAPAIAYASYTLLKRNPDATAIVTPCDHVIFDEPEFRADILSALEFASCNDVLVTLGVTPTRPDPNFGYIQVVGGRNAFSKGDPLPVKTFTEKPPREIARVFIDSGEFLWNSGIFAWKASVIVDEIKHHMPQLAGWFEGMEEVIGTPAERELVDRAYGSCEKQAIDFGVMEKTSRAWVYPADFGWADIGAWGALYDFLPKDNAGNAYRSGDHYLVDSSKNLVISPRAEKLVAIKGLDGFMVVDTPECLVICPRDDKSYNDLVSGLGLPEFTKYK